MTDAVEPQEDEDRERGDQRFFGVYIGAVLDNQDPQQLGRVLVRVPALVQVPALGGGMGRGGQWARVAAPRAGAQRGTWLVPDIGDEVLVAFEAGDATRPYVIGSLWGAAHAPPEQMAPGNPVTSIVSAAGSRITIDDRADHLSLRLSTPSGRSVTLADADSSITIDDPSGATIVVRNGSVEITCAGVLRLTTGMAEITAASLQLNCAVTTTSGLLKCQTLIAENVAAANYTPGVGNVW
jgi:uncharacterized protein involved in type VI secretion and phage assembly